MSNLKKILYLSANCSYSHSSLAFGQLYTNTKKYAPNWNWAKQEYTTKDNINEIVSNIIIAKPDLILSTVYLFNRSFIFDLIKKLKVLRTDINIILGGPEFLGNNKDTLKQNPEIDVIFRGDETSFHLYLNCLHTNKNLEEIKIPGTCYLDKKNCYIDNGTSAIETKNLDSLPSPYDETIIQQNKPFMQIETSRGCFSKCTFCTSSLSKNVKFYSIERIRTDLIKIRNAGYREIRVLDRTFNLPIKRACDLLNMFITEFSDIKFHLEFEPERLSEEVFSILKSAPSKQFHIEAGIQTFYEPSLKFIDRKTDISKTKKNLSSLAALKNIDIHADLIYGLPHQTTKSIYKDLNTLIAICPAEIQLEVLKILPGTKIRNDVYNKIKYSPIPPYEVLSTSEISVQQIIDFSYLSKFIDCFYNHKDMQNVIKFAANSDHDFLKKFLIFSRKALSPIEKPSIKKRIKLLSDYAESCHNETLKALVLFTAYKMGIFDSNNTSLKIIKRHDLKNVLDKTNSCLYDDKTKVLDKPVYLAEFNCNIGEVWVNPYLQITDIKTSYVFRLSQSGLSKKVSRIDSTTILDASL
jgi:radical SAM superfamily enzyme YgiQ (UPF0313 family)